MFNRFLRGLMAFGLGGSAIMLSAPVANADSYDSSRADFLSSGETAIYEGFFLADENIFASCDADCDDLDIYLYDAYTNELIESDTLVDSNPIVTAPYEGDFVVEVVMVTCYTEICEAWTDSDHGF
ncbi:hypothetical protein PN498_06190 [Oscillatoria sp. CS-180]|uniref:hypothetical protein n=1 Tax=Oscillatoria sp. CS-180 TaxID=3021720 RepID=UPI00232BC33D|nr:hypothetical protein [Oscillatoria sp. CS-180]MDB9525570.1 hypothetical protein [Oscillatoria sp. CS-180]